MCSAFKNKQRCLLLSEVEDGSGGDYITGELKNQYFEILGRNACLNYVSVQFI